MVSNFAESNRVSVSSNPITKRLNDPDVEITLQDVKDVFQYYLHLPDTKMLETILAVALSNHIEGTPLWIIFCGASGDTKSTQIMSLTTTDKIIILDDPITSFDAGKRKSTAEVIKTETQKFDQLFVFTCDPLFREFCLKEIPNRNFYYIFITKKSSSIPINPASRTSKSIRSPAVVLIFISS